MTDIASGEPGVVQAKPDRTFGELMRVIEFSLLAVLDAIEPFLLDRGDELAVDEQRGGRFVIYRVDSKNVHWRPHYPTLFRRASLARVASIAFVRAFRDGNVGRWQPTSSSKPVHIIGSLDASQEVTRWSRESSGLAGATHRRARDHSPQVPGKPVRSSAGNRS